MYLVTTAEAEAFLIREQQTKDEMVAALRLMGRSDVKCQEIVSDVTNLRLPVADVARIEQRISRGLIMVVETMASISKANQAKLSEIEALVAVCALSAVSSGVSPDRKNAVAGLKDLMASFGLDEHGDPIKDKKGADDVAASTGSRSPDYRSDRTEE